MSRLEARKVVATADGGETFGSAGLARPGDVIEYVVTYRNTGSEPVKNLVATLPIPPDTELVPGSARPATAQAGVDTKAFGDIPLKRSVQRDGVQVEEPIPVGEYRYLRWFAAELAGEKSLKFSARVKVVDGK
ncbi:MAG: hypothetical protein ACXWAC_11270 [Usitatibacter sp.]